MNMGADFDVKGPKKSWLIIFVFVIAAIFLLVMALTFDFSKAKGSGDVQFSNDEGTLFIRYKPKGYFLHNILAVKDKQGLRFINESDMDLHLAIGPAEEHFGKAIEAEIAPGKFFETRFADRGVWIYHNKFQPSAFGLIYVR